MMAARKRTETLGDLLRLPNETVRVICIACSRWKGVHLGPHTPWSFDIRFQGRSRMNNRRGLTCRQVTGSSILTVTVL